MDQAPADHQPLLLWVPRPLKRELSRQALRRQMLDSELVVEVLQRALETQTAGVDRPAAANESAGGACRVPDDQPPQPV